MGKLILTLQSSEKYKTHGMIKSLLWPWIKKYFNCGGHVWMMPGPHGKMETAIITEIKSLERLSNSQSKLTLYTVDNKLTTKQTGILYEEDRVWKHVVADVFEAMSVNISHETSVAVWLDLCGPVGESAMSKLKTIVSNRVAHGSLLFITSQLRGIRNPACVNQLVFDKTHNTEDLVSSLDNYIKQSVARAGDKRLFTCNKEWPYIYTRKNRNYLYAVFAYGVIDINKPLW